MPKSSAQFSIVARNPPKSAPRLTLRERAAPSRTSRSLPLSPCESLGNKLQRLAVQSPEHLVSIEMLVDHILWRLDRHQVGLLFLIVASL